MMTLDAKNRLGSSLKMLHDMGYDPVGFSEWGAMYSRLCTNGIPYGCVSVGYLFRSAHSDYTMVIEITKDGFCALREPYNNEL